MALIKCPECGRDGVSDSAEACPNCGFRIRTCLDNLEEMKNDSTQQITEDKALDNRTLFIRTFSVMGVLFLVLCFYGLYQESKCNGINCDEFSIKNSKYCEKHTCTTDECYGYKDAWSNVCEECHQRAMEELENDNTVDKLHDELVDKYGEDVFSDEMHMPDCNMSGCTEEGAGTYGNKWYCNKHLREMQGYGNIISN